MSEPLMPSSQPNELLPETLEASALLPPGEHRTSVLYGPLGLRAGWGLALYTALAALLIFLCFTGTFKVTGQLKRVVAERHQHKLARDAAKQSHGAAPDAKPLDPLEAGLAEFSEATAVILAAVVLGRVEKRRFRTYGLTQRHVPDVLPGALAGLLTMGLLIASLWALHLLVFDARLLRGFAIVRSGLGWLLVFLFVGLFEEFFFRGYIQFTLMRGVLRLGERLAPAHARLAAFWTAALTWSVLFGATHLSNSGEDPVGIASVFLAGVVFSYALWRTGSLWWGIGFHTTWDWSQSFLYGVPDSGHISLDRLFATHAAGNTLLSGGTAGPEGSLLVLPVMVLIGLAIRLHPQAEQPPVEPTSLPHSHDAAALRPIP